MVKILHQAIGPNCLVPGLPYDSDTSTFIESKILDDVPTRNEMYDLLKKSREDTMTIAWTKHVLQGFKIYVPSTFKMTTYNMPASLTENLFNTATDWIPENTRMLLQIQAEIETKFATLDAAVINRRKTPGNLGTITNKAHTANRIYNIGRIYNHLKERETPLLFGLTRDIATWDAALLEIKLLAIEFTKEVPTGPREYNHSTTQAELTDKIISRDYPYVDWLENKLKDNLVRILLYGSAARTNDPSLFGDFDNWVVVDDISAAYEVLTRTAPAVRILGDGTRKVIEGCFDPDPKDKNLKPVGIHVLLNDHDYEERHIRALHDSEEFRMHTKPLRGEFVFPKVALDELTNRGLCQSHIKLKTGSGGASWAYNSPEKILGKEPLFAFFAKIPRFALQHGLTAMEGPGFRDKQELDRRLAEKGIFIPKYKADADYIRRSLIDSTVASFIVQKEIIEHGIEPSFDFLSHHSKLLETDLNWAELDVLA